MATTQDGDKRIVIKASARSSSFAQAMAGEYTFNADGTVAADGRIPERLILCIERDLKNGETAGLIRVGSGKSLVELEWKVT